MKVKFVPQNIECEIKPGQSVMHVAQDANLYIKSVCKGVPSCAECRVRVTEGDHNVLPPGSEELALIGSGHFIDRRRLSCQLKCFGDITIDLSEQIQKQQGLLGGKKTKRVVAKDDRVEEMVAIRKSEDVTDEGEGVEIETPRHSEKSRDDRPQRDHRPQQNSRPSRPNQGPAAGSAQQQNAGASQDGQPRDPNRKRRRRRRGGGGGNRGEGGGGGPSGPPAGRN